MEKQYDRKSLKCGQCRWYRPAGKRDTAVDPDAIWPEACGLWATAFHDDEPTEDCSGFMTEKDYQDNLKREAIRKKYEKKNTRQ